MSDYKCAKCGRELASLDEVCDCGNALGVLDSDGIDRQAITLHAHDTPCGHVDRDTSVTMQAEEIVELLDGRDVDVRGCDYCGRHLRVVSDSGGGE